MCLFWVFYSRFSYFSYIKEKYMEGLDAHPVCEAGLALSVYTCVAGGLVIFNVLDILPHI